MFSWLVGQSSRLIWQLTRILPRVADCVVKLEVVLIVL